MLQCSKRSKGHGQGGRGGWGEEGGGGSGSRRPTEEEIALTGKHKVKVTNVELVPPRKRRWGR
jgi:hypothetical protein